LIVLTWRNKIQFMQKGGLETDHLFFVEGVEVVEEALVG
jgi:hypothetical protein